MNAGERRAYWHYRLRGYRILGTNVRAGRHVLDLIVRRGRCLTFVEVKQRRVGNFGGALGYDVVISQSLTNSFRYGFTKIDENNAGLTNSNYVTFRFISPYEGIGS